MSEPILETLPSALDGERLDRVVALLLDVSRSVATTVIDAGGATVDGETATSGKIRLVEGQVVSVDPDAVPVDRPPEADPSVEFGVIHEDEHIIIIDKPAGLVVHPGAGNPDRTLVNGLVEIFSEVGGVG